MQHLHRAQIVAVRLALLLVVNRLLRLVLLPAGHVRRRRVQVGGFGRVDGLPNGQVAQPPAVLLGENAHVQPLAPRRVHDRAHGRAAPLKLRRGKARVKDGIGGVPHEKVVHAARKVRVQARGRRRVGRVQHPEQSLARLLPRLEKDVRRGQRLVAAHHQHGRRVAAGVRKRKRGGRQLLGLPHQNHVRGHGGARHLQLARGDRRLGKHLRNHAAVVAVLEHAVGHVLGRRGHPRAQRVLYLGRDAVHAALAQRNGGGAHGPGGKASTRLGGRGRGRSGARGGGLGHRRSTGKRLHKIVTIPCAPPPCGRGSRRGHRWRRSALQGRASGGQSQLSHSRKTYNANLNAAMDDTPPHPTSPHLTPPQMTRSVYLPHSARAPCYGTQTPHAFHRRFPSSPTRRSRQRRAAPRRAAPRRARCACCARCAALF